jgi:ABC-type phosphate transport system substrate-binding protein
MERHGISKKNKRTGPRSLVRPRRTTLLATVLAAALAPGAALAQVVIVNPAVAVAQMRADAARAVFAMRLTVWPDGTPIRVFALPADHPVHVAFNKKVLGVYPHRLERVWSTLVFTGTGQAPTRVSTEQDMLEAVRRTPGAIGYLGEAPADDTVKVLVVR